jgi:hypothetical protein
MASKSVVRRTPPGKAPGSNLLEDCGRCGVPVFMCRVFNGPHHAGGRAAVEVLEKPTGNVAMQGQLGTDELVAVEISSPPTWYRWHKCKGAFSRAPGAGKVRS